MNMKRFSALFMLCMIAFSATQACIKSNVPVFTSPVTVIVMDTTQALLQGAQLKIGKQVYKTSFDGRVVLEPEQINGVKSFSVSCEGFKDQKVKVDNNVMIVRLEGKTPKNGKHSKGDLYYSYGPTREARSGMMYKTLATGAPMAADAAVMEEAAVATEAHTMPYRPTEPNNVSAGNLTAGEVNDFAKWYFWPRVIDESHKSYISDWRLAPRHRYTVQLRSKTDGAPIASRAVSLLDHSGNTLFQAVTDNTGKAELWYQLASNNLCGKHAGLKIRVDDKTIDAKDWSEGLNTIVLDEECNHSDDVDVVFVFDATGSMGDELRYLQEEMKDVISRAKDATGGLNIRTGAVVYRDHGDEYITRISRLTSDIKTTQAFIDKQEANGGGDYPEAVPEALMAALNSSGWDANARARIAFLILDAPCHQDSATIALLHDQILNAAAVGVRIVPVVCSGLGESGELLLRSIALATNGTSFFLTDDSGIGHSHLKPATDSLKVEHLNDMLVRTIVEFSVMPECSQDGVEGLMNGDIDAFLPNPFSPDEIAENPSIPHGEGVFYIVDMSGKLITIFEGDIESLKARFVSIGLPRGVYFIKTFVDGKWYTEKVLVG